MLNFYINKDYTEILSILYLSLFLFDRFLTIQLTTSVKD